VGATTISQFRTDLALALDNRTDLTDAQLDRWINAAYLHLCQPSVHYHQRLEQTYDITLATSTDSYSLAFATSGLYILDILDATFYDATSISATTTRWDVRPRSIRWLNRRTLSSSAQGPHHFTWYNQTVYFDVVPDSDLAGKLVRLHVYTRDDLLSDSNTTSVLEDYWDTAILLGAQWRAEHTLGYRDIAEATRQDYVAWINEVPNDSSRGKHDDSQITEVRSEPISPLG
jgi:hypothetical protein